MINEVQYEKNQINENLLLSCTMSENDAFFLSVTVIITARDRRDSTDLHVCGAMVLAIQMVITASISVQRNAAVNQISTDVITKTSRQQFPIQVN